MGGFAFCASATAEYRVARRAKGKPAHGRRHGAGGCAVQDLEGEGWIRYSVTQVGFQELVVEDQGEDQGEGEEIEEEGEE
jgi:hypothetical protein